MNDEPNLTERCANCGADISRVPSDIESHDYGVSEPGDIMNHVSRVTCPLCGYAMQRRHQVPFRVRG